MVKLVGSGIALFLLAIMVVIVTQGQDLAALFEGFRAEPLLAKIAWTVIVLAPLIIIPCAVWLSDTLARQRNAARALEARLDGVRQGTGELAKAQLDAEATVQHLARTDPEVALGVIQERLGEAQRLAHVQQGRNEIGDLQTRVEALRGQQQALRERLGPLLDKRRSIEQIFAELDSRQNDIERTLTEIATGDDAVALGVRLKSMKAFLGDGHARCDQIEQATKTIAILKKEFSALHTRLAPFAAENDGVASQVKELTEDRDVLAEDIEALQRTSHGKLADCVQALTDDRNRLDADLTNLAVQFSRLATLRTDLDGLFDRFDRALDLLAIGAGDETEPDIDARIQDLAAFIGTTQGQIGDIERKLAVFSQLRGRLDELQARISPLEAEQGGVANVIKGVLDLRDRLGARIARLEDGDDGHDLATRVKMLSDTKDELEGRVATLTEQLSKVALLRRDIAGLFDRLNSAATTSSN
jgi:chromosome segregation ATPase